MTVGANVTCSLQRDPGRFPSLLFRARLCRAPGWQKRSRWIAGSGAGGTRKESICPPARGEALAVPGLARCPPAPALSSSAVMGERPVLPAGTRRDSCPCVGAKLHLRVVLVRFLFNDEYFSDLLFRKMYPPALRRIALVVFPQFPGTLRRSGRLSCKYIFPDGHLSSLTLLRGVLGFFLQCRICA